MSDVIVIEECPSRRCTILMGRPKPRLDIEPHLVILVGSMPRFEIYAYSSAGVCVKLLTLTRAAVNANKISGNYTVWSIAKPGCIPKYEVRRPFGCVIRKV